MNDQIGAKNVKEATREHGEEVLETLRMIFDEDTEVDD